MPEQSKNTFGKYILEKWRHKGAMAPRRQNWASPVRSGLETFTKKGKIISLTSNGARAGWARSISP
ncbi:MAG: hypothetical protein QME51_09195 [Planctomycetota bacterium]|nr:hypothetical protein [Planctomycetota bacterium]